MPRFFYAQELEWGDAKNLLHRAIGEIMGGAENGGVSSGPRQSPLISQFWEARGQAIDAYSHVERIFCELFAHLTKMDIETASFVFFKTNNTRVLGDILKGLMKKRYGEIYKKFWGSLRAQAAELTKIRNLIVHRSEATFSEEGGRLGVVLIKADTWNYVPDERPKTPNREIDGESEIYLEDLFRFIGQCDFAWLMCSEFLAFLRIGEPANWPADKRTIWPQLFQHEMSYPPQSDNPLYQKWKEHQSRRPQSPGD